MPNAQPVDGVAVSRRHRNAVGLKWNRSPGATGYVVNYGTSPNQLNSTHVIASNTPEAVVGNLQPATTHYFRVQAQPSKPGSPSSELVTATTEAMA